MPRIWRVTVQSASKMRPREEVGAFRGPTSPKSSRGERKRKQKGRGEGLGKRNEEKKKKEEEEEVEVEEEERRGEKKTRALRGERFSRGCRSVGVASASSRVRLTSDLLLKRFHSFPSLPSVPLVPRAAARTLSLRTGFSRMQMLTRLYIRMYARTHEGRET